jgi:hypothetical protein
MGALKNIGATHYHVGAAALGRHHVNGWAFERDGEVLIKLRVN